MRTEIQNRQKLRAAVVLGVLALLLTGRWLYDWESPRPLLPTGCAEDSITHTTQAAKKSKHSDSVDPMLRLARLDLTENASYGGIGRDIFRSYEERVPEKIHFPPQAPRVPSDLHLAVPVRLRFFGFAATKNSPQRVFLYGDDDVFIAQTGEIVGGRYKIRQISSTSVALDDLIENTSHILPLEPR